MRLVPLLAPLVAALFLQGCSTCYTKSMVNVRPAGPLGDFELQNTPPYVTRLLIPDLLDVRIGLCKAPTEQFVCLHLRVAPGQTAVLSDSAFGLAQAGLRSDTVPFPPQQYQIFCTSRGGAPMQCTTPSAITGTELAPKLLFESGSHQDGRFERWIHTVQAATSFVGATGSPDPPASKLFSKYSTWREYKLQLAPATTFTESEALLQLPSVVISGKTYPLPPLSIKVAPTQVCPSYV